MGLFDKIFNSAPTSSGGFNPLNEKEAFIGILYACMNSNGGISDVETDRILQVLVFKKIFKDYDVVGPYKRVAMACMKSGEKNVINECAPLITNENKEMLFAIVMDLMLSDGLLEQEEKDTIEYLAVALSIPESRAATIIDVILVKNKDNIIIV